MIVRKPKSRTVFCRVRDEDYAQLVAVCLNNGRCMSDLLRIALYDLLGRDVNAEQEMLQEMGRIAGQLESLSAELNALRTTCEKVNRRTASDTGIRRFELLDRTLHLLAQAEDRGA